MPYNYLIYMAQVISLDMMPLTQLPFAIMFQTAGPDTPARRHATPPAVLNLLKQIEKTTSSCLVPAFLFCNWTTLQEILCFIMYHRVTLIVLLFSSSAFIYNTRISELLVHIQDKIG